MSETTIAEPAAAETNTPVPEPLESPDAPAEVVEVEPEPATGPDLAAEVAKWKALSKKNELRAKDNADKAKKFDDIEEANKTEMQKLLDRAEAAEKVANDAKVETLRATKSAASGVSIALIPAGTEEQMDEAIAAAIAFKDAAVAAATKGKAPAAPAQIVTAPSSSTTVKQITSRDELKSMTHAQIMAAQKDGRLDELMGKPI